MISFEIYVPSQGRKTLRFEEKVVESHTNDWEVAGKHSFTPLIFKTMKHFLKMATVPDDVAKFDFERKARNSRVVVLDCVIISNHFSWANQVTFLNRKVFTTVVQIFSQLTKLWSPLSIISKVLCYSVYILEKRELICKKMTLISVIKRSCWTFQHLSENRCTFFSCLQ